MMITKVFKVVFLSDIRKSGMVRSGFGGRTASDSRNSSTGYYMTLVQSTIGSLIAQA
jgi:hypothetical protein